MKKAIVSTLEEMPRIQITTENRDAKEEKDFGWSKDPYKNSSVEDRSRVSFEGFRRGFLIFEEILRVFLVLFLEFLEFLDFFLGISEFPGIPEVP